MDIFQQKFKKLLTGKLFGEFNSYFKWWWMEIEDFREYQSWDEKRSINWKLSAKYWEYYVNLFREQKDTNIYFFFDINKNWCWYDDWYIKDKVFNLFSDVAIYAKRYSANLFACYENDWKIVYDKIWKDLYLAYKTMNKLNQNIKHQPRKYRSNINLFLDYQKKINKSCIIILVSDFLWIDENWLKTFNVLSQKNELLPVCFNVWNIWWINYSGFSFESTKTWLKNIYVYNL